MVRYVAFIDVHGACGFTRYAYNLNNPSTSSDIIRVVNTGYEPGSPGRPLPHRMLNFGLPNHSEKMRLGDEIFFYGPDHEVNALHEAGRIEQRAER